MSRPDRARPQAKAVDIFTPVNYNGFGAVLRNHYHKGERENARGREKGMKIERRFVDWEATGNKLFRLRSDNAALRRYVCSMLRKDTDRCNSKTGDCEHCGDKYMDKSISRPELAEVFGVSESVINNWESGRTEVGIEDLLFYCRIAGVTLEDVLVFHE